MAEGRLVGQAVGEVVEGDFGDEVEALSSAGRRGRVRLRPLVEAGARSGQVGLGGGGEGAVLEGDARIAGDSAAAPVSEFHMHIHTVRLSPARPSPPDLGWRPPAGPMARTHLCFSYGLGPRGALCSRTDGRLPLRAGLGPAPVLFSTGAGRGAGVRLALGAVDLRRVLSELLVRWNLRTRPSGPTVSVCVIPLPCPRPRWHSPTEPLDSSAELALLGTGRLLSMRVRARGCAFIVNPAKQVLVVGVLTAAVCVAPHPHGFLWCGVAWVAGPLSKLAAWSEGYGAVGMSVGQREVEGTSQAARRAMLIRRHAVTRSASSSAGVQAVRRVERMQRIGSCRRSVVEAVVADAPPATAPVRSSCLRRPEHRPLTWRLCTLRAPRPWQ